jgi:hypothetical protein
MRILILSILIAHASAALSNFTTAAPPLIFHWGNFSETNACNSSETPSFVGDASLEYGVVPVLLAELVSDDVAMNASASRCDDLLPSLRSWGGTPQAALPDVMYASPVALYGNGVTFVLWFQYECILLGPNSVVYQPYAECDALYAQEPSTYPSVSLRFLPDDATSVDQFFLISITPSELPGPIFFNVTTAWLGCEMVSQVTPSSESYNMVAASFGKEGSLLISMNSETSYFDSACNATFPEFADQVRTVIAK